MLSNEILVRFTFILITCSSLGLAQRSEPDSTFALGGQIVLSVNGALKEPVLVLLDHSGSKNGQRTFTDVHGYFEFHNVPKGSYYIRVRLEGFENVNYPVDVPGTPYVFVFLNGSAQLARGAAALGGNRVVDIRQLAANIPKQAIKEYENAVHELRDHNTQRAIERLEKSIKLAPDFYEAHLGLGQEYRKAGRLDTAEKELTRAFELNPHEVTPLIHLGEIYLDKNNFERAAEVLSQATRIEPGSAIAHYALGRARYKLSDYAEAERAFTRAALLDKDFEAAELMLLHAYVRQGKLSAALNRIDALVQKNSGSSRNPAVEKFRSEVVAAWRTQNKAEKNRGETSTHDFRIVRSHWT
jgi:tetratricopeptide (TPR) repeat protein